MFSLGIPNLAQTAALKPQLLFSILTWQALPSSSDPDTSDLTHHQMRFLLGHLCFHSLLPSPKAQEETPASLWSSFESFLLHLLFLMLLPWSSSRVVQIPSFPLWLLSKQMLTPLNTYTQWQSIQTQALSLLSGIKSLPICKHGFLPVSQCPPLLPLHTNYTAHDTLFRRTRSLSLTLVPNGGMADLYLDEHMETQTCCCANLTLVALSGPFCSRIWIRDIWRKFCWLLGPRSSELRGGHEEWADI